MNKEKTCFSSPSLFYNSLSCKKVKESIKKIPPPQPSFLCEIKSKSLIYLISRHNLISKDLGKAADENVLF